jgi:hypothetical protein
MSETAKGHVFRPTGSTGKAATGKPVNSGNSMHENRETSKMPEAHHRNRPAGEGESRTARIHVFEESDSGIVCAEQRVVQEG